MSGPDTNDTPKLKRTILYCCSCCWAAEVTNRGIRNECPKCLRGALSYVAFHEHEKAQASAVLQQDIDIASVDDAKPCEET